MVPFTKQAADFITLSRAVLFPLFIWFGFAFGVDALPAVIWLMIYNWTADSIDGPLSRRSGVETRTWIGDHDLVIDMVVATVCWRAVGRATGNQPARGRCQFSFADGEGPDRPDIRPETGR